MKNKLFKLAAKATAVSMVVSMFATALPAGAALATNRSVTVTRHQAAASAGVNDTITFTAQETMTGDDTTPPTLQITLGGQTGVTSLDETMITVSIGGSAQSIVPVASTCAASANQILPVVGTDTQIQLQFCTGSTAVSAGTQIIIVLGDSSNSLTNPGVSTGTFSLSCTQACSVTGDMLVPFITSDQVTVTANIAQTMVFDVGVNANCNAAAGGGGTVALGSLTTASVHTGASHICLALDTNADGGAVVQVKDAASGLVSTTPSYTIQASGATQTLAGGTEGYGLCIDSVLAGSGSFTKAGNFATSDCTTHLIGQVTSTFADLANTGGNPVDGTGYQAIDLLVKAAVASTTPASTAYADTLTFRATATF